MKINWDGDLPPLKKMQRDRTRTEVDEQGSEHLFDLSFDPSDSCVEGICFPVEYPTSNGPNRDVIQLWCTWPPIRFVR